VTAPLRASPALVAITVLTVALPTPESGVGLPIHSTLLRAVHEQPGVADNSIESSTCVEGASAVDGDGVYRQGAAACETSTV
jgi:hypothetical protein